MDDMNLVGSFGGIGLGTPVIGVSGAIAFAQSNKMTASPSHNETNFLWLK
ncbi:MAG: hypothetical protein VKK07_05815 [Merismopediaceae bacterium]|nr:hypothetical protein [Merismopediaceae bacterium]